jgi:hypothetical protein
MLRREALVLAVLARALLHVAPAGAGVGAAALEGALAPRPCAAIAGL